MSIHSALKVVKLSVALDQTGLLPPCAETATRETDCCGAEHLIKLPKTSSCKHSRIHIATSRGV